VLELGSWRSVYATQLRQKPVWASFFEDGERLYTETDVFRDHNEVKYQRVIIDLRTTKQEEYLIPFPRAGTSFHYRALSGDALLGTEFSGKTSKTDALVKVELPAFREVRRVAFAEKRSPSRGLTESDVITSANRKFLVYTVDN